MSQRVIFGRTDKDIDKYGIRGCGYLGKIVSYPAGRYEEMGEVQLDLAFPHCMLVMGKRGTGKSYTLGVMAESFGMMEAEQKDRLSVLIVDTMSVFHSLKTANSNAYEVDRLKSFNGLTPKGMGDYVHILMPKLAIAELEKSGHDVLYDQVLQLPLHEISVQDWLDLFGLTITDPVGTLLIKVIRTLQHKNDPYGYEDIYREIDNQKIFEGEGTNDSLKGTIQMIEDLGVFDKEGTPFSDIVKAGRMTILDISYLGRLGGFDIRNLIVSIIASHLMRARTLYTTLEMQAEANLIDEEVAKDITKEHPLVYMMIDEAHLFLPNKGKTIATDALIDWIKLGRHPGLSLILATQEPSALHQSAIKQADLIIAHNVTAAPDIEALKMAKQSYTSGTKDFDKLVSTMEFRRGLAVIMDDKTRKMELVCVRPRMTLHTGLDATLFPRVEKIRSADEKDSSQSKENNSSFGDLYGKKIGDD